MQYKDFIDLCTAYADDIVNKQYRKLIRPKMEGLSLADKLAAYRSFRDLASIARESIKCKHEKLEYRSNDSEKCADCGAMRFTEKDPDIDYGLSWGGPPWGEWRL